MTTNSLLRLISAPLAAALLLSGCAAVEMQTAAPVSMLLTDYPAERVAEDLEIRELQPGFWVATHSFPWPHNSLVAEMADSTLVLVDTPYTPEATRALAEWAEQHFGERERIAINTGFHYDNLGGNAYLIEAGIPVYGADAITGLIAERGESVRALTLSWLRDPKDKRFHDAHAALRYEPPDRVFPLAEGLSLAFGGEELEVFFPGPTHSPDNVVVYFPSRRILFGGCMILAGDSTGNTADADLAAWPVSLERLRAFAFDLLIPGHGDRLDPGLLDHSIRLLQK